MKREKANAPLQPTRPQSPGSNDIIPKSTESVKPTLPNKLRALRLSCCVPAKDMVDVVRRIYPKYDKTIQSKCERGEEYGIDLKPDAMDALVTKFSPAPSIPVEPVRRDRHRLTHRITCRLEKVVYDQLQQRLRRDEHTTQDWLAGLVRQYLNDGKEKPHD